LNRSSFKFPEEDRKSHNDVITTSASGVGHCDHYFFTFSIT
jgi:hypothetical protein